MDNINTEIYTAGTAEHLWQTIQEFQKGTVDIPLKREDIVSIFQKVEKQPYGMIHAWGGYSCRPYNQKLTTTWFDIAWYTWRKEKWIKWKLRQGAAHYVPPQSIDKYNAKNMTVKYNQLQAWRVVFPDRYWLYRHKKYARRLKKAGVQMPEGEMIGNILDEEGGMVLIITQRSHEFYLCSPLGTVCVGGSTRTVYSAAKKAGIAMPRRKDQRTWERIKPLWIMAALSRL